MQRRRGFPLPIICTLLAYNGCHLLEKGLLATDLSLLQVLSIRWLPELLFLNKPVVGHYDYRLVGLSVVIAICAAYAALELAARIAATAGLIRRVWLAGGAIAMGMGIWSMHYVGMLAFALPIPVLYHWPKLTFGAKSGDPRRCF